MSANHDEADVFVPTFLRCEGGPRHGKTEDVTSLLRPARIGIGSALGVGMDGEYVENTERAVLVWHRRTWRWWWRGQWARFALWRRRSGLTVRALLRSVRDD